MDKGLPNLIQEVFPPWRNKYCWQGKDFFFSLYPKMDIKTAIRNQLWKLVQHFKAFSVGVETKRSGEEMRTAFNLTKSLQQWF